MKNSLFKAVAITLLTASAGASFAATSTTFDFAHMESNGSIRTGYANGVVASPSSSFNGLTGCTGSDLCSSKVTGSTGKTFGGSLNYAIGSLSVSATGSYYDKALNQTSVASVVQDHIDKNEEAAGLGVYHKYNDSSDDNVTKGETLKMSFNQVVSLSSIAMDTDGHTSDWAKKYGASNIKNFLYSTDNVHWDSGKLSGTVSFDTPLVSEDFYFRYGGAHAAQFYLGAMSVTAVPEPETYAMLLAGLGLMGTVIRRRKNKQSA